MLTVNTAYLHYPNLVHLLAVDDDSVFKDFIGGVTFTPVGSPIVFNSSWGGLPARSVLNTNTAYFDVASGTLNLRFGGNSTFFLAFSDASALALSQSFLVGTSASIYGIYTNNSTSNFAWTYRVNTSNSVLMPSSPFPSWETVNGSNHAVAGQRSYAPVSGGAGVIDLVRDGVDDTPGGGNATAGTQLLPITRWGADSAGVTPTQPSISLVTYCCAIFSARLTTEEILDLHQNWPSRLFVAAAASTRNKLRGPLGGVFSRLM